MVDELLFFILSINYLKNMKKFFKKPIVIIVIVLALGGVGWYAYSQRSQPVQYEFVTVKKDKLVQEVDVTGRVSAAESVDLAFEQGGRISFLNIKVGDKVEKNSDLARLDSAELSASLAKASAALDMEKVRLSELQKGPRAEEISISENKVSQAKQTVIDAETNLKNVKSSSETSLTNVYADTVDVINDAYSKSDDAVNKQIEGVFTGTLTVSPQLSYITSNSQAEYDSETGMVNSQNALVDLTNILSRNLNEGFEYDKALSETKTKLILIRDFLNRIGDTLNVSNSLSASALSTYRTSLNTARTNINTALTNINTQEQAILTQKQSNTTSLSSAETSVNDAKQALTIAENQLALLKAGSTSDEIASQQTKIKQAEAGVAGILAQLSNMVLRAPISGVITEVNIKRGEIVGMNTKAVSLISESEFEIKADVPEADIAKVSVGDVASVTLDAYGEDTYFNASVVSIDPAETIIEGVPNYQVTLQFNEQDARIKSGMTANVTMRTEEKDSVIAIPQRAITVRDNDKIVSILEGEIAKEVVVKTGVRDSFGNIEIIEGLSEGQKVITSIK